MYFKLSQICIAFTLVLSPFFSENALGETSQRAFRELEAKKACLTKQLDKGIKLLVDLYIETEDPTFLYNQGRCFEQNTRYNDAIGSFEEYLRKVPSISDGEKAEVSEHIAACNSKIESIHTSSGVSQFTSTTKPETVALTQGQDDPIAPNSAVPLLTTASDSPSVSGHRGLRIAGLVLGAVGVVSVGAGVYYFTQARELSTKITDSDFPSPSDHKAGEAAVKMQWVCYSVGAAALLSGGLLYLLGIESSNPVTAAVTPVFGSGLAGISAQGSF